MTPRKRVLIAALLAVSPMCGCAQESSAKFRRDSNQAAEMTIMESGQLLWTAQQQERAGTDEYCFFLDPTMGLMDVDFHPVKGDAWKNMKSPGARTTASLVVAPGTTMDALECALQALATDGGYQSVEITVGSP